MRLFAALIALPLAACVAPTGPGQVIAANGKTVTVRGAGDYTPSGAKGGWKPNAAIVAQANDVCRGAKFASGVPESPNSWAINYLFICP